MAAPRPRNPGRSKPKGRTFLVRARNGGSEASKPWKIQTKRSHLFGQSPKWRLRGLDTRRSHLFGDEVTSETPRSEPPAARVRGLETKRSHLFGGEVTSASRWRPRGPQTKRSHQKGEHERCQKSPPAAHRTKRSHLLGGDQKGRLGLTSWSPKRSSSSHGLRAARRERDSQALSCHRRQADGLQGVAWAGSFGQGLANHVEAELERLVVFSCV